MPITTRQKILDYLKRARAVSSREVARALQMTPANARRHLSILATDGRVEVFQQRQEGRGRPKKVYRLAGTLIGENLSALSDALLSLAGDGIEIEAVGRYVAGELVHSNQPLMRRLASTVNRLNTMHYQARWEAGAEGPRIILGNCPYSTIIDDHPELCRMDAALLGELLEENLQQTAKLESGAGGLPFCAFMLTSS